MPTVEKPFWPDFLNKLVEYAQYSPHLIKKSDSKWLFLVTAPILGQAPRLSLRSSESSHWSIGIGIFLCRISAKCINPSFMPLIQDLNTDPTVCQVKC